MKTIIAFAALLATTALAAAPPTRSHSVAQSRTAIAAALADPARADQAGDDARRQAAAVLAFSGVGAGDTVIDFLPGNGYWTRIFSGVVGPRGHVTALWPGAKYAEKALPALQARKLANVSAVVQASPDANAAGTVDLFWTAQNYHDLPAATVAQVNAAVFRALKPGGTYLIVDHADAAGAIRTEPFKHRIDPAVVRSQVLAAGFRFVGSSAVLANPADDHSTNVFDPAIRGKTDQFVLKFKKPG